MSWIVSITDSQLGSVSFGPFENNLEAQKWRDRVKTRSLQLGYRVAGVPIGLQPDQNVPILSRPVIRFDISRVEDIPEDNLEKTLRKYFPFPKV